MGEGDSHQAVAAAGPCQKRAAGGVPILMTAEEFQKFTGECATAVTGTPGGDPECDKMFDAGDDKMTMIDDAGRGVR